MSYKKLIRIHNLSILVLIEPMLSEDQLAVFSQKLNFSQCLASRTNNIWVFVRHNFQVMVVQSYEQTLHVKFTNSLAPVEFYASFIYAKHTRQARRDL